MSAIARSCYLFLDIDYVCFEVPSERWMDEWVIRIMRICFLRQRQGSLSACNLLHNLSGDLKQSLSETESEFNHADRLRRRVSSPC